MQNGVIAHIRMSISFLSPPIVLKTMPFFTSLAGIESASAPLGVREKGTSQGLWLNLRRSKAGCFPHYKLGSQNQDGGRGWIIDSPVEMSSAPPSLTAFFLYLHQSTYQGLPCIRVIYVCVFLPPRDCEFLTCWTWAFFPLLSSWCRDFFTSVAYMLLQNLMKKLWTLPRNLPAHSYILHATSGRFTGP